MNQVTQASRGLGWRSSVLGNVSLSSSSRSQKGLHCSKPAESPEMKSDTWPFLSLIYPVPH